MNKILLIISIGTIVIFSGCSSRSSSYVDYTYGSSRNYTQNTSTSSAKNYSDPKMKPYVVRGIRYYPTVVNVGDTFDGTASWYGPDFHGKLTSNGEVYNMYDMTAAHKTLPMNTILKVTNLRNGRTAVVRVNDRGPFVATRIIDLSKAAANELNMIGSGTAHVSLEVIGFEGKGGVRMSSLSGTQQKPKVKTKLQPTPSSVEQEELSDFALQIASFSNFEGAMKTREKYDNTDGYTTVIKDTQTANGRMFKVLLKGFRSEQEARDYKATGPFSGAFIVREN